MIHHTHNIIQIIINKEFKYNIKDIEKNKTEGILVYSSGADGNNRKALRRRAHSAI